jgi:hypothetical protein
MCTALAIWPLGRTGSEDGAQAPNAEPLTPSSEANGSGMASTS